MDNSGSVISPYSVLMDATMDATRQWRNWGLTREPELPKRALMEVPASVIGRKLGEFMVERYMSRSEYYQCHILPKLQSMVERNELADCDLDWTDYDMSIRAFWDGLAASLISECNCISLITATFLELIEWGWWFETGETVKLSVQQLWVDFRRGVADQLIKVAYNLNALITERARLTCALTNCLVAKELAQAVKKGEKYERRFMA